MKAAGTRIHFFVIALALVLVNWRASTPGIVRVRTDGNDPIAVLEISLAVGLGVTLLLLLRRGGLLRSYAGMWRGQLMLLLFSAFALLSVVWSVSPSASLYKWAVFALATLVGSYLGFRFPARGLLEVLFWYGAILVILSAATALLVPGLGRMFFSSYSGAWRGIFWHKNHLGTLVALLNVIYLYRLEDDFRTRRGMMTLDGFFYVFTILIVWLSRSATAYLVLAAGNGLSALAYIWHRTRARLRRPHYLSALVLAVVAIALIFAFLPDLLAMLGKDATLTGRIPMWRYVLTECASQRPILGYGMGAFWNSPPNQLAIQHAVSWGYPVAIGDNGWLDVLLGLGGVGLAAFCLVLLAMLSVAVERLRRGQAFVDSLPLVFLLMACLANLAFSLFFEIESGVWLVLVAFLFLRASHDEPSQGQVSALND